MVPPPLCTIYGVSKVRKIALTFRQIIDAYKQQADSHPVNFLYVPCHRDSPPRDIIHFYNHFFVPAVKDPLLRVAGGAEAFTRLEKLGSGVRMSLPPEWCLSCADSLVSSILEVRSC